MGQPERRYVENDVPPEQERLAEPAADEIRARCARELAEGVRRLVEASPPGLRRRERRFAGGPTLYLGLLGQAFGFLHLFERSDSAEHLELSRRYLGSATDALQRSRFPGPEEWVSFHGTGGVSAVAAAVQDRLGNEAERDRHLEAYGRVAVRAADPDFPSEDLLWGRGGFLFGAAFLRARLGAASVPEARIAGALEAMLETGRRRAGEHARHLTPGSRGRPPLVYTNLNAFVMACFARAFIPGRSWPSRGLARAVGRALVLAGARSYGLGHRYDLGLVHGLPGNLYLMMHFPELLRAVGGWQDVRTTLDILTDYVDAERGMLELLPSPYSAALHRRVGSPEFTERVHWCSGTPAAVFLFARAYEVFGDAAYLETARRAAEHVWKYGLLRKGNGICHGIAGNGYAFLTLHRISSDTHARDRALHFARATWDERIRPPWSCRAAPFARAPCSWSRTARRDAKR